MGRKKNRETSGRFLVEGWRSVMAARDAGASIEHMFISPSLLIPEGERSGLQGSWPVFEISDPEMKRLSDVSTPPGIVAVIRKPDTRYPETWPDRIVLLDGVQDPGNVGTLIRTAAWLGIECVGIGPGTADPYAPKVVRSTMGGLWDTHIMHIEDLDSWMALAAGHHASIWVTDMQGTDVEAWHPSPPAVLVVGNEAHGVSDAVRQRAAGIVSIPGGGGTRVVESLNAAVAGAIIMSRWTKAHTGPV